jgi:hypothetical protein
VDTDILDENIISYDQIVTKQEMVEAFKNDATPGVQAVYLSKRYTKKENEVTINWNSSVQKKSNTKETVS